MRIIADSKFAQPGAAAGEAAADLQRSCALKALADASAAAGADTPIGLSAEEAEQLQTLLKREAAQEAAEEAEVKVPGAPPVEEEPPSLSSLAIAKGV